MGKVQGADQVNETIVDQLIRHEGIRYEPYLDSEGILTIGVGHNLQKPLSNRVVMMILEEDIQDAEGDLFRFFPIAKRVSPIRQNVLINMCFNLGAPRLKGFRRMWAAIEAGNYDQAAEEMLDSKWRSQVGTRAIELAEMMRNG